MASTGTADNMNAAVSRLTEQRSGLRFDRVDPFASAGRIVDVPDSDFDIDPPSGIGYTAPAPTRPAPTNGKSRPRSKARKPRKQTKLSASGRKLRKLASPVLLALAIGLVVPAVWSVLVLIGLDVAMSDHDAAKPMAMMMLVCWPLAAFMAIAAGWMIRDLILADRMD